MAEKLAPLTTREEELVQEALQNVGDEEEQLAVYIIDEERRFKKYVIRRSLRTLRDGEWINDEIVEYYLFLLRERDKRLAEQYEGWKRSFFFNGLFYSYLTNVGHPTMDGQYTYKNVRTWTKYRLSIGAWNAILHSIWHFEWSNTHATVRVTPRR